MKRIEAALHSIDGYLISISRDTVNGWYELQIGLPPKWVYDKNEKIDVEVVQETDAGMLLKVAPKTNEIVIDDLISFVQVIIKTNEKIAKKEKQFTDKMEAMKGKLEEEAKKFYEELDDLRDKSFKNDNETFVDTLEKSKPSKTTQKSVPKKTTSKSKPVKKPAPKPVKRVSKTTTEKIGDNESTTK